MSITYAQSNNVNNPMLSGGENGDLIVNLPVDQNPPSNNEIEIVQKLFTTRRDSMNKIFDKMKEPVIVFIVIILVSLPQVEELIKKFITITQKSEYFLIFTKALIAAGLFWIIKHFHLSRANSV